MSKTEYIPMMGIRRSDAMNNEEQKRERDRNAKKFDDMVRKAKESFKNEI